VTRNVGIVGGGHTRWGAREATYKDLIQEAGKATFDDVDGVGPDDVEGLFVGSVQPERFAFQTHVAPMVAELLGLDVDGMIARTELACASGQAGLRYAWLAIAAGEIDTALVLGVEKMNLPKAHMPEAQASMTNVMDREFDGVNGLNAPPYFAMIAQRHMHEYGTTREQMAQVSAKNKSFAAHNEFAQFQDEVSVDDVLDSFELSPPLCLYDCSGITDGAAGLVLMSEEKARAVTDEAAGRPERGRRDHALASGMRFHKGPSPRLRPFYPDRDADSSRVLDFPQPSRPPVLTRPSFRAADCASGTAPAYRGR
jgi:acetyl-CoA C-acetyltransferase